MSNIAKFTKDTTNQHTRSWASVADNCIPDPKTKSHMIAGPGGTLLNRFDVAHRQLPNVKEVDKIPTPKVVHDIEKAIQKCLDSDPKAGSADFDKLAARREITSRIISRVTEFLPQYTAIIAPVAYSRYAVEYESVREEIGLSPTALPLVNPHTPVPRSDNITTLYQHIRGLMSTAQLSKEDELYFTLLNRVFLVYTILVGENRNLVPPSAQIIVYHTRVYLDALLRTPSPSEPEPTMDSQRVEYVPDDDDTWTIASQDPPA